MRSHPPEERGEVLEEKEVPPQPVILKRGKDNVMGKAPGKGRVMDWAVACQL